jgi:hypothetical protein
MNLKILIATTTVILSASLALAQSPQTRPERQAVREPPPQAYTDCQGKKTGDTVQHTTREGKVAATCVDSPKGLVARPNQPPNKRQDKQTSEFSTSQGKELQK